MTMRYFILISLVSLSPCAVPAHFTFSTTSSVVPCMESPGLDADTISLLMNIALLQNKPLVKT